MTEAELQNAIRRCALEQGWLYYHPYDSRRSDPGFPDTELVRGLFVCKWELKDDKGRPTREQVTWLDRWRHLSYEVNAESAIHCAEVRIHVALIRPADLDAAYWLLMGMKPSAEHPWPAEWVPATNAAAA